MNPNMPGPPFVVFHCALGESYQGDGGLSSYFCAYLHPGVPAIAERNIRCGMQGRPCCVFRRITRSEGGGGGSSRGYLKQDQASYRRPSKGLNHLFPQQNGHKRKIDDACHCGRDYPAGESMPPYEEYRNEGSIYHGCQNHSQMGLLHSTSPPLLWINPPHTARVGRGSPVIVLPQLERGFPAHPRCVATTIR